MGAKLSKGNEKLGNCWNISLPPIKSCQKNVPCISKCYAMKAYRLYPSAKKCWDYNLSSYLSNGGLYFDSIFKQLSKINPPYFRWHVAGDIPDQEYYDGMIEISNCFPKTNFLCFTKNYLLNFDIKPKNLIIVISAWPGLEFKNGVQYKFPVAYISDDNRIKDTVGAIKCNNMCEPCGMKCFLNFTKQDIIFDLH